MEESIEITEMREEDLEQVVEIEEIIFSMPWSKKSFLDSVLRNDTIFLVAKHGKKVIGYGGLYCMFDEGEITNVAVSPLHRRTKVGKKLVEQLVKRGKEKGVVNFLLEVRMSNEAAIKLYENLGFVAEGIRKNFYEKPLEDGIVMWNRES